MIDLQIVGIQKNKMINQKLIAMLVVSHDDFARWFYDRFLKWGGDPADIEDQIALNDAVNAVLLELSKKNIRC